MSVDNWYFSNRGIKTTTLDACGILRTDNKASWVVGGATKSRENFNGEGRDRVMYFEKGQTPRREVWWCGEGNFEPELYIICEGETDAMRTFQELEGAPVRVGCLSGVNFFDKDTFKGLEDKRVVFIFDNDDKGGGEYGNTAVKAVNDAWAKIRTLLPDAKRAYLPTGFKDLCEFFDVFDIEKLREVVKDAATPRYQYEALDLTRAAEPPVWLWETKMARGDIVIFQSEPNMGKSFVSMGLAVAIVEGSGVFLGHKTVTGKVLIVDEENPEDVIRNRLAGLGLTAKGLPNLRVVHEQGVRLDRNPEKLKQEAEAFKPDLVILDSLTRLHTEDENNAGAVSRLFNESIHPLARKIGATVLVLHHVNKGQAGSSFARTRGSSDINGVVDAGYDMVEHEFRDGPTKMMLNYKNRRGPRGSKIFFQILDRADGTIELKQFPPESGVF